MSATHRRRLEAHNCEVALHRLPNELLSQIFQSIVLDSDWRDLDIVKHLAVVCGVCSRWRHAAIGTPNIWSSIIYVQDLFEDAKDYLSARGKTEDRIITYLERSKQCSIDVFFHHSAHIGSPESDALLPPDKFFKKVILPHLSRCRTLYVQSSTFPQLSYIFPLTGRLDRLKSLCCSYVGPDAWEISSIEGLPMTLLPENNGVHLLDLTIDSFVPISVANIDGSTLLSLDLEGTNSMWDDVLDLLLRAAPVLQTLRIDLPLPRRAVWSPNGTSLMLPNDTSSYSDLSRHPKFALPALRNLSCDGEGLSNGLGAMLDLPNLTHAKFSSLGALIEELDDFNALLLRGGIDESHIPVGTLLGSTSHLQYLTLRDVLELRPLITELLASNPTIIMFEMIEWASWALVAAVELLTDGKKNNNARVGGSDGSTGGDDSSKEQGPLLPSLRVLVVRNEPHASPIASPHFNALIEIRPNLRIVSNQDIADGADVVPEEADAIFDGSAYSIQV